MLVCLMLTSTMASFAQGKETWTKRFFFELDRYEINYNLPGNQAMMDSTVAKLKTLIADSTVTNLRLDVTSSSSLEASDAYNTRLSANRTAAFLAEVRKRVTLPFEILFVHENVFDWDQLYELTAASPNCPERARALEVIRSVPPTLEGKAVDNKCKLSLQALAGGATYKYMMDNLFPQMRNTSVVISYFKAPEPVVVPRPISEPPVVSNNPEPKKEPVKDTIIFLPASKERSFVFAVKTNMLYDAAITPNIGVEFYLAPNFALNANWAYAWWHNDKSSFYWRAYGGDAELRYYIAPWRNRKDCINHAFEGHHIGLYGLMATYDYEFGNNGQQAPKWSYGGGVAYGYSKKLTKRLNIDFTLGLGCLYGKYHKYEPSTIKNDDYYWLSTQKRKYWGPTKAEVSLVWKIGRFGKQYENTPKNY